MPEDGGRVEGMEADIYPRQCVTGSAKSAMMNVLAGINPQCTPPPPSSSAVPPPPTSYFHPSFPLAHHLSHPFTARSRTLSKRFSFFLSLSLSLAPFLLTPPPAVLFLGFSFALTSPRCFSFGPCTPAARLYTELARHCSFFATLNAG